MASGSSDAGNVCPWPASILLEEEAYFAAGRNDTTARARSKDNHTVEITFWIADPPAASLYTFRCIKLAPNSDSNDVDLRVHSAVAGAHGGFLLIRTLLAGVHQYEYFVYKGHPESPSLESIPLIPFNDRRHGVEFGIVPRGDDGHYLLIALHDGMMNDYRLHIYSSEDRTWRAQELRNPCRGVSTVMPDKALTLGDGSVLWVDFLRGIVICDVLREPHRAQYIPLPEPLPGNRERVKKFLPGVRLIRDVTCVDGLIKFIEIEHRVIVREITDVPPEKPSDPRTKDVLYDSELIVPRKHKPVENKPKLRRSVDGWSAIIWTREIGSSFWLKGSVVDGNDISVDDSALLSSKKSESAGSLTFKNQSWVQPTLSMDGNDIVYLKSFVRQLGVSVLAAVDFMEKTLKVEAPGVRNFAKHPISRQTLRPCALANQLKMTPGIKVSASQIALMGSSANEPNSTAIRVGEPDSYESENKRPRQVSSENKRPRPLAEKVNHPQNGAQSTVQNVLISQAHPNQTNMPPRLCFNRYEQPGYSGYSSWPHQHNLPPPPPPPPSSCFNQLAGPYNPVYAPSAPAPNIQSYVNYQWLPQQPLLPEQLTTPSMTFGPHMVRPIYTSTTGMEPATMGVHSSIDSYAYGAHSGSGIYHQR